MIYGGGRGFNLPPFKQNKVAMVIYRYAVRSDPYY